MSGGCTVMLVLTEQFGLGHEFSSDISTQHREREHKVLDLRLEACFPDLSTLPHHISF